MLGIISVYAYTSPLVRGTPLLLPSLSDTVRDDRLPLPPAVPVSDPLRDDTPPATPPAPARLASDTPCPLPTDAPPRLIRCVPPRGGSEGSGGGRGLGPAVEGARPVVYVAASLYVSSSSVSLSASSVLIRAMSASTSSRSNIGESVGSPW